ncbi:AraC family transcriptional regulator [uncultured Chitinophaga sp.]|jgi:AraC-type DNA-binding domain-containing proteins|uniref:helix-turn-helix domain-containing protein n=1 Tax=uncultured Chitinophaga sp. TaxID=339340 RepID=UPI00261ADBD3|nr:AraC family transcriptional regulator [uncultured Chitinophaga sp.]
MSSRLKQTIPVHILEERSPLGLEVWSVSMAGEKPGESLGIHRDDHYIFVLLETGESRIMIDFQTQCLKAPGLLYVQPGQVHEYVDSINASGWFVAVDAMWVGDLFQPVLHEAAALGPLCITTEQQASLSGLLKVLEAARNDAASAYFKPILHSLVSAFTGMVAGLYAGQAGDCKQALRSSAITASFRQLLTAHYKTLKSPADYAGKLNLSLSYLNETVKANTGFPVSYWIQQETMLEARRLLYYSKISVKEIAYQLGYEDPTYFSRVFKKVVGLSPGDYRRQNRE